LWCYENIERKELFNGIWQTKEQEIAAFIPALLYFIYKKQRSWFNGKHKKRG